MPISYYGRQVAGAVLILLSAPGFANDEALASEFANCSVVYYMVERLSKNIEEQNSARTLSSQYNVYANALASAEFVRMEKTKARVMWRDEMALLMKSGDKDAFRKHLVERAESCIKISRDNDEMLRPRVKELANRLLPESAR